jgi:[CysO sulfur-carrier protein]-S-L-cysteine hydrolase
MRIELAPELEKRFRGALRKAGRREIGGMLMAEQLAPGHFRIVEFSLDQYSGSHSAFRRDPAAHRQTLNEFFVRTSHDFTRFNYLGEWHSHPSFPVYPSGEDMRSMTDIVEDRESEISFAVLLILRLRLLLWMDYSLTVFARQRKPNSMRLVSARASVSFSGGRL